MRSVCKKKKKSLFIITTIYDDLFSLLPDRFWILSGFPEVNVMLHDSLQDVLLMSIWWETQVLSFLSTYLQMLIHVFLLQ